MDINEAVERAFKFWILKKSRVYKMIEDGDIPSENVRDEEMQSDVYKCHAETPDGKKSIKIVQQIDTEMRSINESLALTKDEIEEWKNKGYDPTDAPDALVQASISFAKKFDEGAIVDFKEWKSLIPDLPMNEGKHITGNLFEIQCTHCSNIMTVNASDRIVTCPKCKKDNLIVLGKKST